MKQMHSSVLATVVVCLLAFLLHENCAAAWPRPFPTSSVRSSLEEVHSLSVFVTHGRSPDLRNWFGHVSLLVQLPTVYGQQKFLYNLIGKTPSLTPFLAATETWKNTNTRVWCRPLIGAAIPSDSHIMDVITQTAKFTYATSYIFRRALSAFLPVSSSYQDDKSVCSEFVLVVLRLLGVLDATSELAFNIQGSRPDLPFVTPSDLLARDSVLQYTRPGLRYGPVLRMQ